jgi:hypothetical protein
MENKEIPIFLNHYTNFKNLCKEEKIFEVDEIIKLLLYRSNHKIKKLVELSGTTEERIAKMRETIFG